MAEDNFDKGQPVTNNEGKTIAYFSDEYGLVYEEIPSDEDKAVGAQFIDAKNKEIDEENRKKLAEFQSTEEYALLSEREQVLASAQFRKENFAGKYLGGSDDKSIVFDDSLITDYRKTSEYQSLNEAERIIAECDLKIAYSYPDYSKETDPLKMLERENTDTQYHHAEGVKTDAFLKLNERLQNGEFNVEEARIAADWLRENYANGYDLNGINRSAKEGLAIDGQTVDKDASDAIPVRGQLDGKIITYVDGKEAEQEFLDDMRGKKQTVDANATRAVIDTIGRDETLSPEEKNQTQLNEAREYCVRTDKDFERDHSEKGINCIKDNVLRYYPDLAQQLDKEGVSVRLQKDRWHADNVDKIIEMNPEIGMDKVSGMVQEGAEQAGVDISIRENAPRMEAEVNARKPVEAEKDSIVNSTVVPTPSRGESR